MVNDNPKDYKTEEFKTVNDRQTYFQKLPKRKPHVRLRARQVLCHNCKGVCSETGENVQRGPSYLLRRRDKKSLRDLRSLCVKTLRLVPRIKRLCESEIKNHEREHHGMGALSRRKVIPKKMLLSPARNQCKESPKQLKVEKSHPEPDRDLNSVLEEAEGNSDQTVRSLRVKRCAIGSMEDLWDESFLGEPKKKRIATSSHSRIVEDKPIASSLEQDHQLLHEPEESQQPQKPQQNDDLIPTAPFTAKSVIANGDVVWAKYSHDSWWPAKVCLKNYFTRVP